MRGWKEVKLGEYITTNSSNIGRDYPYSKILYLDTGSITRNKIEKLQEFNLADSPSRAKRLVENNDIIYSSVRPNQLHYGFIENPEKNLVVSTGFIVIECDKDKLHPKFLFYHLSSENSTEYLHSIAEASTSTYPSLKPSDIEALDLMIPPLPEQKAIAEVLSSLDDKIDLLHRQNKTLEQMAETLFRQWFVEERDESWEEVSLGDYVACYNGVSYKSSDLNSSDTAMVTLKSFSRDGGIRLDGFKEYTGNYKTQHIVKPGDLAVAHTDLTQNADLIGNPIMIIRRERYKILLISMDLVKVEPKTTWFSKEFLYYLMKNRLFKEHCLGYSNGSTVLHLSKKAIPLYEFFMPPKKLIEDFTYIVRDLLEKENENINQTDNLEKLKDNLLPKLMSGEVRLNI